MCAFQHYSAVLNMATLTMILTSKNKIPWTDEEPQTNAKNAYVCACILVWPLISGVQQYLELAVSGGGGRSALRPGGNSRACRVDRPPALFSYAEENPRPKEPVYSSSTGDGTGSGGPDRQLNSGRIL
jgi:hypothetical protein